MSLSRGLDGDQIAMAHADGPSPKLLGALARLQLLVLDDWGDLSAMIP